MESKQETNEEVHYEDEATKDAQNEVIEQETEQEGYVASEGTEEQTEDAAEEKNEKPTVREDRSGFVHGLCVGLGIGCIATFVIMWITVFFTPQLPSLITYEALLAIFIYPLIYLLAIGLIALTAGIVREYYARKSN
jgi:fructose-specific phosphotransferase system IIC component